MDNDGSGNLSPGEVERAYMKAFINGDETEAAKIAAQNMAKELISGMDIDKDGVISRDEYTSLMGKAVRRSVLTLDAKLLAAQAMAEAEEEDEEEENGIGVD